jgi:L-seryl-tRNA(Ser) seleniumtransferase
VVSCASQAGSGSLPTREIASFGVRVTPTRRSVEELAAELRKADPAVLARIHEGALVFDVRTLADEELPWIGERLRHLLPAASFS